MQKVLSLFLSNNRRAGGGGVILWESLYFVLWNPGECQNTKIMIGPYSCLMMHKNSYKYVTFCYKPVILLIRITGPSS